MGNSRQLNIFTCVNVPKHLQYVQKDEKKEKEKKKKKS